MQASIKNLAGNDVGSVELSDAVFGVEVRADILQRVVLWQLAKRRAGTHKVKSRAEIARTGAKLYKQKGTGRARHGSRRVNVFRGGGVVFGPVLRDHATDLPKKVRALGLRCALSSKAKEGKLVILDSLKIEAPKTKALAEQLGKHGFGDVLFVDGGDELETNFALASRNLPLVDLLPVAGANVYDILRRDKLVLTTEAVRRLEERLA